MAYINQIPGCTYALGHEWVRVYGNTVAMLQVGQTQLTPAYTAHRFDIGWGGGYDPVNKIEVTFRVVASSYRVKMYFNSRPSRAQWTILNQTGGTWSFAESEYMMYTSITSPSASGCSVTAQCVFTQGWLGTLQFMPINTMNAEATDVSGVIVFDSFKINDVEQLTQDTTQVSTNIANSATWTVSTGWNEATETFFSAVTVTPLQKPNSSDYYVFKGASVYDPDGLVTPASINFNDKIITFNRFKNGLYRVVILMVEKTTSPYVPPTPGSVVPDTNKPSSYIQQYITAGFYKIFVPTNSELLAFINHLYSQSFMDSIINIWNSVIKIDDLIVGAKIVPVSPTANNTATPKVGWVEATGITMHYTEQQYVTKSLGSITIPKAWSNYLDYAPYTSVTITLPFIGERQLATNDVMGKTITLEYNVDLLSGECVAYVIVDNAVHYQFTGNTSYTIPMSVTDTANMYLQPLKALAGLALAAGGLATGNPVLTTAGTVLGTGLNTDSEGNITGVTAPTPELNSPITQKIDNLSGNSGYMGIITPYVCIERTMPDINAGFGHANGYLCNKYMLIGNCVGYTKVSEVHLENISCTTEELTKIEALLKGGVIL